MKSWLHSRYDGGRGAHGAVRGLREGFRSCAAARAGRLNGDEADALAAALKVNLSSEFTVLSINDKTPQYLLILAKHDKSYSTRLFKRETVLERADSS